MATVGALTRTPLVAGLAGAASVGVDLGVEVAADYGDPAAEERALTGGAGLVDRCVRGSVLVTGPDAGSFLQSVLSQDVDTVGEDGGAHALLLQPQGKLDTDLWVWRTGPETFRLGCEVGRGAALAESLGRWKIRVKAEIADQTGRWGCLSLRGARGGEVASGAAGVDVPEPTHAHRLWPGRGEVRLVRADWPVPGGGGGGTGGVDVVGPVGDLEGAWEALVAAGAVPAGLTAYEAARVRAGVPRQGPDLDERTIPQEAFLEVDAVSFTKGCFIGQELVCRIHDRGRVNRLLRRLRVAPGSPAAASDTTVAVGAAILWDGKEVGTVTTVARSEAGVVALGYLRREVEMPAEVTLRWDGGEAPAQVTDLSDLSEPA